VGRLDAARRAGRSRGDRDALEVERDQEVLGLGGLERHVGRVRQPGLAAVAPGSGNGQEALLEPVAEGGEAGGLAAQALAGEHGCGPEAHHARHVFRARPSVGS
jgi:hypothetical protein